MGAQGPDLAAREGQHGYYIYRVSGYAKPSKLEPALLKQKSDYIRYVFLFDACDHEIVKQLQPNKTVEMM